MTQNVRDQLQMHLRQAAVAIFAIGAMVGTAHASPPSSVVAVTPTDLPAVARQTGEAMLLHDTIDCRILLCIEQNHGARLATFDVADPVHIKGQDPVHLDASGSFDFISPLGRQAEPVRFRQGKEYAVLDFPRVGDPKLIPAPGLTLPGLISGAGHSAAVAGPTMAAQPALYFVPIDALLSHELSRMFDVKQVRAQMMRTDAGTTVMQTERLVPDQAPGRRVDSPVDGNYAELSGGGPGARYHYGLSE